MAWTKARRTVAASLLAAGGLLAAHSAFAPAPLPNPRSLEEMGRYPGAVVRLYSAPLPFAAGLASHSWFAVKGAGERDFERWEVWHQPDPAGIYLRRNLLPPESGVGAGSVSLMSELTGNKAQLVSDFIRGSSADYPCRDRYFALGPNSNTYPAWVIEKTGWKASLPWSAIGRHAVFLCR